MALEIGVCFATKDIVKEPAAVQRYSCRRRGRSKESRWLEGNLGEPQPSSSTVLNLKPLER